MSKKKKVRYDQTPYTNYANYLQGVDTGNVDSTLSNLTQNAYNQSQQLGNVQWNMPQVTEWDVPDVNKDEWNLNNVNRDEWNFPTVNANDWQFAQVNQSDYNVPEVNKDDWTFRVNAGDDVRKQAQDATYNSYMERMNPQFDRQRENMATMLQNQGIPVGSEAYNRAMGELEQRQNDATNQAAYQSVLAGNNAYSQSLQDEINAGNFGNNATNSYYNAQLAANQGRNDYLNALTTANQNQALFTNTQLAANQAPEAYANALRADNEALSQFYDAQNKANSARSSYVDTANAANYAQQAYINQILAQLQGSPSGYENQQNLFTVKAGKSDLKYQQDKANANRGGGLGTAIGTIGGALAGAYLGGPTGASVGARAGGTLGGLF